MQLKKLNNKLPLLFILLIICAHTSFAQKEKMTREDKQEKIEARAERIRDKTDYTLFRRQMLSLKEYAEERRKVPVLQKTNKEPVKVTAVVDSLSDGGDKDPQNKTLTGYIRQTIGDNSSEIYEVTFDRTRKIILSVKRTGDGDTENEEKATGKKTKEKIKTVRKKNSDEDEDEEEDEQEKPGKKKQKQKTTDNDDD
jgi:hypothetical protein